MKDLYSYICESKTPKLNPGKYNIKNSRNAYVEVGSSNVRIAALGYLSEQTMVFDMRPKDFISLIPAIKDGSKFNRDFKMVGNKSKDWEKLTVEINPQTDIIIMKNYPKNEDWNIQQSNISLSGFKDIIDEMVETI